MSFVRLRPLTASVVAIRHEPRVIAENKCCAFRIVWLFASDVIAAISHLAEAPIGWIVGILKLNGIRRFGYVASVPMPTV